MTILVWNGLRINVTLPSESLWIVYRSAYDEWFRVEEHPVGEPDVGLPPGASRSWTWNALSQYGYPRLEPGFYRVDVLLRLSAASITLSAFFWLR